MAAHRTHKAPLLLVLAGALAAAAPARADELGPAMAYWGATACGGNVVLVSDQAALDAEDAVDGDGIPRAAHADDCTIVTGTWFATASESERCAVLVHEYGHLLGHDHHYEGDADQVMVYQHGDHVHQASICSPPPVAAPTPAPEPTPPSPAELANAVAWDAYFDAWDRRADARERRAECRYRARQKRTQRARRRAARACARRIALPPRPTRPSA